MKVAVVGTGYVGLVTGTCLAEVGHEVCCIDASPEKIEMLNHGESPIFEPGLTKLIKQNIGHGRLNFTQNLAEGIKSAQILMIAVGTPCGTDGSADLQYVNQVAKELGQQISNDVVIVVKSTVPVGTCDQVERIIRKELSERKCSFDIAVASNPEFLAEGGAISDFMRPDRIIVGLVTDRGRAELEELYDPFIIDDPGKLLIIDRRSSELTKYGSNAMLATRISFMNEMARLCERVGANIDDVRRGMGADVRIGKKFLYAGPGYGGSCFPKDVKALLKTGEKFDLSLRVLNAVDMVNREQREWIVKKIASHYKNLTGKKIAVWGLAFKPGTDDTRDSPAIEIVQSLITGGAEVYAHDPEAEETFRKEIGPSNHLHFSKSSYDVLKGADGLILVTEWPEYRRPNWDTVGQKMREKVVFDFRNQYNFKKIQEKGFKYYCIGRPDSRLERELA